MCWQHVAMLQQCMARKKWCLYTHVHPSTKYNNLHIYNITEEPQTNALFHPHCKPQIYLQLSSFIHRPWK